MLKHQKTLLRTDRSPDAPWTVGCSCGWSAPAVDEKQATKLHTAHRKVSKPSYRIGRKFGGGVLFVKFVPPINGEWGYTFDQNEAVIVDDKTRLRYQRHLRAAGLKGVTLTVAPS